MQAAIGYPLTVHGTGGQTQAFIRFRDTVRCIELAIENPPLGERVILNQMTETHRVRDLAKMIADMTGGDGIAKPRNEDDENDLHVENSCFLELGLEPTTLEAGLMDEVQAVATKYSDRCDKRRIRSVSFWNKTRAAASKG